MSIKCILQGQKMEVVKSFNGRTGIVVPQLGDYTAAQVGALAADGTAVAAMKLAVAQTIQTNLASTNAADFDGTGSIIPGVTGILPIECGGTGVSSMDELTLLIKSILETLVFNWGDETAIGDATWWADLKKWATNATAEERKSCIGRTKKVSLAEPVLGANAASMICIGADQDGIGTLTFQTEGVLPDFTLFDSSALEWNGSTAQLLCNNFGNQCSAFDSLKIITKLTCQDYEIEQNETTVETTSKCWLPSECEMAVVYNNGTSNLEWTKGISNPAAYSYYNTQSKRVKYLMDKNGNITTTISSYWLRSRGKNRLSSYALETTSENNNTIITPRAGFPEPDQQAIIIDSNGDVNSRNFYSSNGLAPAFVVG